LTVQSILWCGPRPFAGNLEGFGEGASEDDVMGGGKLIYLLKFTLNTPTTLASHLTPTCPAPAPASPPSDKKGSRKQGKKQGKKGQNQQKRRRAPLTPTPPQPPSHFSHAPVQAAFLLSLPWLGDHPRVGNWSWKLPWRPCQFMTSRPSEVTPAKLASCSPDAVPNHPGSANVQRSNVPTFPHCFPCNPPPVSQRP
jgi:hypothetical protein